MFKINHLEVVVLYIYCTSGMTLNSKQLFDIRVIVCLILCLGSKIVTI